MKMRQHCRYRRHGIHNHVGATGMFRHVPEAIQSIFQVFGAGF